MTNNKFKVIIPARSGSKGLPDKNLRELAGHSLLAWSIKMCLKCSNRYQHVPKCSKHVPNM